MRIKVGVIFGGETVEHEVSIISAVQAMNNMDQEKYEIIPIYITKDRIWYTGHMLMDIDVYKDFETLKRYAKRVTLCKREDGFYLVNTSGILRKDVSSIDIAFPIVHGNNVEDGSLQGYLDTIGIPYVGSKVLGSSLGQDKVIMKQIFSSIGLNVVPYTWFFDTEYQVNNSTILENIDSLGYPVIVKPAHLGSSVGITFVQSKEDIDSAINEAIKYDTKIVVEKAITDMKEVNCAVLGNYSNQTTSAIEEVIGSKNFLTYADKYMGSSKSKGGAKFSKFNKFGKGMVSAKRKIPADITDNQKEEIEEYSKKAFKALNLSGVCRIDYMIDTKQNKIYINEPNTIPGSLSYYLWEANGKEYSELLNDMITLAIKEYKEKERKTYSFDTNILSNYNGVKGLKK
ncbi:MAG: D-alanine--D-alanine ligase [Clostridium sp.]|nr:D-alanine--D-alanine ligase [Clostridium sp.]MCM1444354.1 D-alanine--D-alanine ligase [Candidatus Amulumruptor caecigallinarius]